MAIRKSPRSLVRPLKPATTTPVPELVEILKMPWNGEVILSNPGIWPRNAETCPLAGIVRLPEKPAGVPESVVASRLTVIAEEVVKLMDRFAVEIGEKVRGLHLLLTMTLV